MPTPTESGTKKRSLGMKKTHLTKTTAKPKLRKKAEKEMAHKASEFFSELSAEHCAEDLMTLYQCYADLPSHKRYGKLKDSNILYTVGRIIRFLTGMEKKSTIYQIQ